MEKEQNIKERDIDAELFLSILHLKEEKNKVYSCEECEKNVVYLFDNYDEFKNYFLQNGFTNMHDVLLDLCRIKTTKKGTIIALKGLCDYTITKHNSLINKSENITSDNLKTKNTESTVSDSAHYIDAVYDQYLEFFNQIVKLKK